MVTSAVSASVRKMFVPGRLLRWIILASANERSAVNTHPETTTTFTSPRRPSAESAW